MKEVTPGFDGARLDDIVDYLTFVFVPMLMLYRAGTLPDGWGLGIAGAVLLSSAYGFASLDAKTDDYFFTGFPSYWNIVALYIHAARTPPAFNAALLLVLVAWSSSGSGTSIRRAHPCCSERRTCLAPSGR